MNAPNRSKFAGITCSGERNSMLAIGSYRVRVVSGETGWNSGKRRESYKIGLQVIESDGGTPTGAICLAVFLPNVGGINDLKRLVMIAAGYGPTREARKQSPAKLKAIMAAAEQAFDLLDERTYSGSIIESTLGTANEAPNVISRLVDVDVSRGKDTEDGDFYRVYTWSAVEPQ